MRQRHQETATLEGVARLDLIPDTDTLCDHVQTVFVTGNSGFTAAETVKYQAQFTGQEGSPGGLPGRTRLQRRFQRRLEMLAKRGWSRMDIGNAHPYH